MNCRNILIVFMFVINCLVGNIFAISSIDAKDVASKYTFNNEFIDNTSELISCKSNSYYIISILDSSTQLQFFVPINNNNGVVYIENDDILDSLFKSAYLLNKVRVHSNNNYLSLQLVDKINQLTTILDSKNSQLQGIINSDYSIEITNSVISNQNDLELLIETLKNLNENLNSVYRLQEEFINSTNCSKSDELIVSFKDAFKGYNNITAYGLSYQNSANNITEKVVADTSLNENTKRMILNYTSSPVNLSSDLSTIYASVSKTNSFYNPIITELLKSGVSSPITLLKENLLSRKDYVLAKSLLYTYDSDLEGTLDASIKSVLDPSVVNYWNNTEYVEKLKINYVEINNLYSDSKYTLVIPKIKLAKTQLKKIKKEGFVEINANVDNTNYYISLVVAVISILLLLFLRHKKSNNKNSKYIMPKFNSTIKNKSDPFS